MKTVLNRFKFILVFIGLFACAASAQHATDISLKLSVVPSLNLSKGQQGTMIFEITNNSQTTIETIFGASLKSIQGDGQNNYTVLHFTDSIEGRCATGSLNIQPPIVVPPLWLFQLEDLQAGQTEVCKINFVVPQNTAFNFTTFAFKLTVPNDYNLSNNAANVRINIKKRVSSVPVLNIWGGFALLLALMVAARQRYKKGV